MVLRHKLGIRIAAAGWLGLSIWLLVDEATPQEVLAVVIALLLFAASFRALIIVRADTVYRRRLFGWDKSPVRLSELTAVSLRREPGVRTLPLTLRLSGRQGAEIDIECLAWAGWRELAHRAGHFAGQLRVSRDDVTERRMACTRDRCEWESYAEEAVRGKQVQSPPDDDLSTLSLLQTLGLIAGLFALGFVFGLFVAWIQTDVDAAPLVPFAFSGGSLFALGGLCLLMWEKARTTRARVLSHPTRRE